MEKRVVELVGTFFLVLTVLLAGSPVAVGAVLIALVYMGGAISGAHYNPAVSFAMMLVGKLKRGEFVGYVVAQCVGAALASIAAWVLGGRARGVFPAGVESGEGGLMSASPGGVFLLELAFSFLFVLVVLMVAASRRTQGNQYFGVAIGLTVMAGASVAGPISGGSFNPAVGFVVNLVRVLGGARMPEGYGLAWVPLYLLMPLIGAMLGVAVYKGVEKDEGA